MRKDWKFTGYGKARAAINKEIVEKQNSSQLYGLMDLENRRFIRFSWRYAVLKAFLSSKFGFDILHLRKIRITDWIDPDVPAWDYFIAASGKLERDKAPLSPELISRYQLFDMKACILEVIMRITERAAYKYGYQEAPYLTEAYRLKAEQAKKVLNGERDFSEIYYVQGWADLRQIDVAQAAAEIKFQAEETAIALYQIEYMRQKFTQRILQAQTIEEVEDIAQDFEDERFVNAQA